jgi:hypothetical protein
MIVSEHRDPHGTRLRNWDRNANGFKDTHLAGAAVTMDAIDWGILKTRFVSNIQNQVAYAVSQAHYPGPAGGMKENPNDPANVTIDGQKVKFEDFRRGLRDGSLSINFIALPGSSFSADGITITRTQGYDYNEGGDFPERIWGELTNINDVGYIPANLTSGAAQQQTPAKAPCDVKIPADSNDLAVFQTLMGESAPVGDIEYLQDQGGGKNAYSDFGKPGGRPLGVYDISFAMSLMVYVIQNRLRDWGQSRGWNSWHDVVNATYTETSAVNGRKVQTRHYEFVGYPYGKRDFPDSNSTGKLGRQGDEPCERARAAILAIDSAKRFPPSPNNKMHFWRAVKQQDRNGRWFIRARQGATRTGNTDFF